MRGAAELVHVGDCANARLSSLLKNRCPSRLREEDSKALF